MRFALFGAGFWTRFQVAAWREIPGVKCVAIYNRAKSKAEALARELNIAAVTATPQVASLTGFTRATHRLDLDWSPQSSWMLEPESLLRSQGQQLTPVATQTMDIELPAFGLTRLQLQS